jgi:hypothetical protein
MLTRFQMMVEHVPHRGLSDVMVIRRVAIDRETPERPGLQVVPEQLWTFLRACWEFLPEQRLNMAQVLRALRELLDNAPIRIEPMA